MNNIIFRFAISTLIALPVFGSVTTAAFAQDRRPNLIVILAEDLGYGDLGCFGQKTLKTPRLDEMAKEGMRFTQFYAGNSVCAPSRYTRLGEPSRVSGRVYGEGRRSRRFPIADRDPNGSAHGGVAAQGNRLRDGLCRQMGRRNA